MKRGYVKLWRKVYDNLNAEEVGFLSYLMTHVNYKTSIWRNPLTGRNVQIKPGMMVTSRSKLSTRTGYTEQKVRTLLKKMELTSTLTSKTTNHYTLIKLYGWGLYQGNGVEVTSKTTSKTTTSKEGIKNINNNTTSGKKPDGKKKVCKRKKSQFSEKWYIICLQEYQRLKGIKLQGEEYKPLQQTLKTIFMSGRTPADIIKCMKFMADDDFYKTVWTLKTVKLKLPEFLAEKLNPDKQYSQEELREQYNKTLRR